MLRSFLAWLSDHWRLGQKFEAHRRLLSHYCDFIYGLRSETANGMVQFVFEAQLLPEDHRAGMRLELRGRDWATA